MDSLTYFYYDDKMSNNLKESLNVESQERLRGLIHKIHFNFYLHSLNIQDLIWMCAWTLALDDINYSKTKH